MDLLSNGEVFFLILSANMLKEYFAEFKKGIFAYWKAHKVIRELKLWHYFIFPLIAGILFSVAFYYLAQFLDGRMKANPDSYMINIEWYRRFHAWLSHVVFWPFMFWVYTTSFKYVVLAMISPLLARLSATVEVKLKGIKPEKNSFQQMMKDITRAIKLAFRNVLWETSIELVLLIIPYIRGILVFGVSGFYSGFSMMDYTLERKRYSREESIEFMRGHRGLTLGLGLPFYAVMLIPFAGVAIVPVYGVVAATIAVIEFDHSARSIGQEIPDENAEGLQEIEIEVVED